MAARRPHETAYTRETSSWDNPRIMKGLRDWLLHYLKFSNTDDEVISRTFTVPTSVDGVILSGNPKGISFETKLNALPCCCPPHAPLCLWNLNCVQKAWTKKHWTICTWSVCGRSWKSVSKTRFHTLRFSPKSTCPPYVWWSCADTTSATMGS